MTEQLAIIAPDVERWEDIRAVLTASAISVAVIRKLDEFAERQLTPADTIVVIDADQNVDRWANFMASLVRNGFVGIITVSHALSLSERVSLMCMGADHCLLRPVNGEELTAIANNMFRRSRQATMTPRVEDQPQPWRLDLNQWRLITPGGHQIGISAADLHLLEVLFKDPGKLHRRDDLCAHVAHPAEAGELRAIDVQISRLRRKVEDVSSMQLPLRSARGAGYVFASPAVIIDGVAANGSEDLYVGLDLNTGHSPAGARGRSQHAAPPPRKH